MGRSQHEPLEPHQHAVPDPLDPVGEGRVGLDHDASERGVGAHAQVRDRRLARGRDGDDGRAGWSGRARGDEAGPGRDPRNHLRQELLGDEPPARRHHRRRRQPERGPVDLHQRPVACDHDALPPEDEPRPRTGARPVRPGPQRRGDPVERDVGAPGMGNQGNVGSGRGERAEADARYQRDDTREDPHGTGYSSNGAARGRSLIELRLQKAPPPARGSVGTGDVAHSTPGGEGTAWRPR